MGGDRMAREAETFTGPCRWFKVLGGGRGVVAGILPDASSAPFVATLVDVTRLIMYFSVAFFFMHGTLLSGG